MWSVRRVAVVAWFVAVLVGAVGCGEVAAPAVDAAPPDVDATIDMPPDMPPSLAQYDVAYVDEITFPFNYSGISGFLVIVNRGTDPLSLSKAAVVSVTDDNDSVTFQFTEETASTTMVSPDHAAGFLSQNATTKLISSGFVSETIDDRMLNFQISFLNFPPVGIDIVASAKIRVADADLVLPMLVHVVAGDHPSELNHVSRLSTR